MDRREKIERLLLEVEATEKRCDSLQRDIDKLQDAITHTVNRMLRQTILKKSHAERNRIMRMWCRELIQIQNTVDSTMGIDIDDIPF